MDLLLNGEEAVRIAKELEVSDVIKVTSISIFEIYKGIKKKDKINKIDALFNNIIVLNFDKNSAKLAGRISKELSESGQEIDPEDCMMAAITISNNESLLTKNLKHFNRIKGLNYRPY